MAWRKLGGAGPDPEAIVELKRKSSVVRLERAGPRGGRVIAKLCQRDKGILERSVYEDVLPRVALRPFEFFGCVDSDDGTSMWLFLEDVGDVRLDPDDVQHVMLAADWFGRMQAWIGPEAVRVTFPERSAAFYENCLQAILESVSQLQSNRSLPRRGHATLQNIAADCHALELDWSFVVGLANRVPVVLSHNDSLPKNVHVRRSGRGLGIAPFDWGGVGWAPAGADLGLLTLPHMGPPADPRIYAVYKAAVAERWPALDVDDIRCLAGVGQLFWALKVICRGIPELTSEWRRPEHMIPKLAIYEHTLARSIEALSAAGTGT